MAFSRNRQTTTVSVDNVNNNTFSPNVVTNVALNGLDSLGQFLRDGFESLTNSGGRQSASLDQAGINVSTAIDAAGINVSNGLVDASENLDGGISRLGANIGFSVVAGAGIITIGRVINRG